MLKDSESIDARLAAAAALGNIKTPEAVRALAAALDDRDPALQFVGVNSMKSITGRDFGGSVQAWKQFAAGETQDLVPQQKASVADRLRELTPF